MKLRSLLLAALLLGVPSVAWAQANPAPAASLPQNGIPFLTVPQNEIVGGPVASQIQDASQTPVPVWVSGGCTTTTVITGNAYAFKVVNGASGCGTTALVLTLPAAAHIWVCALHDITSATTNTIEQSANASVTSVAFLEWTRAGVAASFVANAVLLGSCNAS
jgi:acetyl esterase/lipase